MSRRWWKAQDQGSGLAKLQAELSRPMPCKLAALPTSGIEMLCCVRCGNLPEPHDYLVCQGKGHHTCGPCVARDKSLPESRRQKLEECCEVTNLQRGNNRLYQLLLNSAIWKCIYEPNGCDEKFHGGKKLEDHIKVCTFHNKPLREKELPWTCRHFLCVVRCESEKEMVKHYSDSHGARAVVAPPNQWCHLPVSFQKALDKKHLRAVLEFNGNHFVLAIEVNEEAFHLWVWKLADERKKTGVEYSYRLKIRRSGAEEGKDKVYDNRLNHCGVCMSHTIDTEKILTSHGKTREINCLKLKTGLIADMLDLAGESEMSVSVWLLERVPRDFRKM